MVKAIDKIRPLDIKLICPGHGPVHKELAGEIVRLTEKYSDEYIAVTGEKDIKRVLIAYVSAYGYTGEAADLIAEGLAESGRFDIDVADIDILNRVLVFEANAYATRTRLQVAVRNINVF